MIEKVAEALFHKVMKNRYAAYQLASDYEVIITTHQGFVRKLSTISGSENDLANLCLRLAIATLRSNKLVGNLGFIILDEITSSFDEERTRQTLEGLMELRDIIPQIINISHKPVEIAFADKLISLRESNGKSIVTIS
jgi:DNA repair exonuclease SbcCD ATPase subunit